MSTYLPTVPVAVIEGDDGERALLSLLLAQDGPAAAAGVRFDVHQFPSLSTFLSAASSMGFRAALADLYLPDSEGIDTVHAVRSAVPDMAVVILTGDSRPSVHLDVLGAGAAEVLEKSTAMSASVLQSHLLGYLASVAASEEGDGLADRAAQLLARHDGDGRVRWASAAAFALTGSSGAGLVGVHLAELVLDEDRAALEAAFSGEQPTVTVPVTFAGTGAAAVVEVFALPSGTGGVRFHSVTTPKGPLQPLLAGGSVEMVPAPALVVDEGMHILDVNRELVDLAGAHASSLVGSSLPEWLEGVERSWLAETSFRAEPVLLVRPGGQRLPVTVRWGPSGRTRVLLVTPRSEGAGADRGVDPLTGLLSGARFRQELRRLSRRHTRVLTAVVDVDRFGVVNQEVGFSGGDAHLRVAGERLVRVVGDGVAARIGGDVFAVAIPADDPERPPEQFCQRLTGIVDPPVTVSVGWTITGAGRWDAAEPEATVAARQARAAGGNRVQRFSAGGSGGLAGAVQSWSGVSVAAQPVVDLEGVTTAGQMVAVTVSDGRAVERFVDCALSLDDALDVLTDVLGRCGDGPGPLLVPVPAAVFENPGSLASVLAAGVGPGRRVTLLVAEVAVDATGSRVRAGIAAARAVEGVEVGVFEFGRGSASLRSSVLAQGSVLVLDPALCSSMHGRPEDRALVEATVGAFAGLVIAAGVDRGEMVAALGDCGVRYAFGNWWGAPAPVVA